jgi:hypothetical protein
MLKQQPSYDVAYYEELKRAAFYEDHLKVSEVLSICDYVRRDCSGRGWDERQFYTPSTEGLIEEMVGGFYCIDCTMLIALERFIAKWRVAINTAPVLKYRDTMCQKIRECIKKLESAQRNPDYERFCCCGGSMDEVLKSQASWDFYQDYGPGIIQADENGYSWIETPDVTPEEFERRHTDERMRWQHDMQMLFEKLENHLAYFTRVPHKIHQEVFFALSSKSTPSACAKHILSFL